ncbi:LOC100361265 [Phodopus roborovskii]|uniref:LOC100361265 protein n=1 Tax=Phodopus roborovskii TaxID=109678 RepID=A0AAU9YYC4_PHORO|nr:LOC100361265 [Phodopus roborovskii]
MSSPNEVSVRGSGFGPESGEHSEGRRYSHGYLRGHGLSPNERLLQSSEDKLCLPVSKTFQYDSWLDRDETEGRSVIWGCEGRPGTPVDERGDNLDFVPQLAVEGTSFGSHAANREAWGVHRHPSPKSSAAEPFGIWGDSDAGTRGRGMRPPSSVEGKQFSASQLHSRGLGRGRAWVTPRRGATSRIIASDDMQYPSSDPESSDEFSETQMMRVTICLKEGGQAKSSGLTELEDTARHTNVQGRGSFVHVPPSVRGLSSGIEKQASGDLEGCQCKKKQSVVWGKDGSRLGYPGASAASASTPAVASAVASGPAPIAIASGTLPKTSPRKKTAQEKPLQWDASRGPLGRTFPPWGQRLKSAPVEPATFPPISGVALLGKTSKCSLPSGPKECKPFCTGKRAMAKKTKESQPVAKEDNDQTRDIRLQAQLPTHRAEQPCTCLHRGEMTSGDHNFRAPHVPGNSQLLTLSQRSARPRAPAPGGDQELSLRLQLPVGERQYQTPGTMGCQQCLMLQKEIEELKEQLGCLLSQVGLALLWPSV